MERWKGYRLAETRQKIWIDAARIATIGDGGKGRTRLHMKSGETLVVEGKPETLVRQLAR